MTRRAIVNSCGPHHRAGQGRLMRHFPEDQFVTWVDPDLPLYSPPHQRMPYAFKAWALKSAAQDFNVLLWCDACIVSGPRPLRDLWEKIERDGVWIMKNGFKNSEWTANEAYPLLGVTREENDQIEHVVAGAFGIDLRTHKGQKFLEEYLRLAMNGSFRGPSTGGIGVQHRQDQTAASVICHRLGVELSLPPEWFSYKGAETEATCLVADGNYENL
jgi:hypothetical protein